MIFKVNYDIFNTILDKLPFLRFNDTSFVCLWEEYLSKNGQEEEPWINPEDVLIHRITASRQIPQTLDFEKDFEAFKSFCREFLSSNSTMSLCNLSHYILIGKQYDLKASQIANWEVCSALFDRCKLKAYLELDRCLIRIPCGSLNLNIVKFLDKEELYLEITSLDESSTKELQKLQGDLQLSNPLYTTWTDLYLNH